MKDQVPVTILMATYNGAAYLARQLDSIVAQQYSNWSLVIRDDGSTDDTLAIIARYVKQDPRISTIDFGTAHGSACINFGQLAAWAARFRPGYVMFADQDDLWQPNKVLRSIETILAMEQQFGQQLPLLAYSRFQFIDSTGNKLPQQINLPAHLSLRVLINENHGWGCTMILNASALTAILPIPEDVVNHDYWIALVIAALGKTKLINESLILYRQHQHNVSGNVDNMSFAKRFNRYFIDPSYMIGPLTANLSTVVTFNKQYSGRLSNTDRNMLNDFISAYQQDFLSLSKVMFTYKIFKIGIGKNLIYLYTLLLLRKKVVARHKLVRQ